MTADLCDTFVHAVLGVGREEFLNLMAKLVGRDPYEELNDP